MLFEQWIHHNNVRVIFVVSQQVKLRTLSGGDQWFVFDFGKEVLVSRIEV